MKQYGTAPVSVPMKWYGILMVLLTVIYCHYYHIDFVVNSHISDPGQSLINDNLTVVSIVMSTFKE